MICRMEKDKRKNYRRRWMAASRSLQKTRHKPDTTFSSDDDDDVVERVDHLEGEFSQHYGNIGHGSHSFESHSLSEPFLEGAALNSDTLSLNEDDEHSDINAIENFCNSNEIEILSSDSDFDDSLSCEMLAQDLSQWVNSHCIDHNATDSLLGLLRKHGHSNLPMTARTLLGTPKNVPTEMKSGMQYIYFGVEKQLLSHLELYPEETLRDVATFDISLNIDGLPLFKSTSTSLWPVICSLNIKPTKIFPLALTLGNAKPFDLEFLRDTVQELNRLLLNGLNYKDHVILVKLKCIICDAPAKAFIKSIKLYSGYYGCDRCDQRGRWIGRMTYPTIGNIRTDQTFRSRVNDEHHHEAISPFCDLQIDMISQFPLDYMHLICLGVVKKLLLLWKRGKKDHKLSARQIDIISRRLIALRPFIPENFSRKPRGLDEVDRWKATELRQFILYTGKIVLKGVLPPEFYMNFMALSVAVSILVSPNFIRYHIDYAHQLLEYFVESGRNLYGEEFLVYNVHSLLHLTDDARTYGNLDNFSAFIFENYLQKLKKMVRSGKSPLVQIVKRLEEMEKSKFFREHTQADACEILKIKIKKPNNAFIIDQRTCCEVVAKTNQKDQEGNILLLCRLYERPDALFLEPCDSRIISVFKAARRNSRMKLIPMDCLRSQAILIDEGENTITFMAVLHEI